MIDHFHIEYPSLVFDADHRHRLRRRKVKVDVQSRITMKEERERTMRRSYLVQTDATHSDYVTYRTMNHRSTSLDWK